MTVSVEYSSLFSSFLPDFMNTVTVTSEVVSSERAKYVDLFVLVDNSMSMGIGQTKADRDKMLNDRNMLDEGLKFLNN